MRKRNVTAVSVLLCVACVGCSPEIVLKSTNPQSDLLFVAGHRWRAHCHNRLTAVDHGFVYAPSEAGLAAACGRVTTAPIVTTALLIACVPGTEDACVADSDPSPPLPNALVPYETDAIPVTSAGGAAITEWQNLLIYAPMGNVLRLGKVHLAFTSTAGGYKVDYRIDDYYPACKIVTTNSAPVTLFAHLNDGGVNRYFALRDYPLDNARLETPASGSVMLADGEAVSNVRLALRGYCQ